MTRRPRLFVGSSIEGLEVARAVQSELDHDAEVTLWSQNVFEPSGVPIDSLVRIIDSVDFAILVFSPDDVIKVRGKEHRAVRDNVILELGLAIGKLGRRRSFVLHPRSAPDLHIPTDLLGVTPETYDPDRSDANLMAAVGPACSTIRHAIRTLGLFLMRPEARIADPRTLVLEGIRHLQSILARSLGPAGARVSIETTFGEQLVTRSGADIVGSTSHPDPLARQGITAMARLAHEMAQTAGDGTKLPILLAARILERAFQATTAGHSVREVIGGMEAAVDRANEALATQARPVTGGSLSGVASTAAMDSELGNAITAAIEKAGRDGIVSVDASDSRVRLQITATEGMTLDRGFLRPEFATEAGASMSLLEDCSILIFAGNMSALSECLPLLEKVVQSGRPLLVIGDSVEGEVLATLVLNHQRGILRCAAIRAPGYDAGRQALLQDIAVYTGAKLIDPDIGMTLRGATLDDLGRVRIARITNDSTTLIEGAGRVEAVQARADQIRGEIVSHANDYETEKAHVRLASLQGRIVTILVGGSILAQRNEDRRRLIAGLHSAHAGIRSGWVLGGGVAFVRARAVIKSASERNAGRKLGKQAIERALEEPLRILAGSIGEDETQVLMAVERGLPEAVGLNVATGALEDLAASGILDPTSTLQKALTLALSAAKEVLQTETWEAVEEPHGEGDSHVPQTKPPLG